MYSLVCVDNDDGLMEHPSDWRCKQCKHKNDKSHFSCQRDDCNNINIPTTKPQKTGMIAAIFKKKKKVIQPRIKYEEFPLHLQRQLLFYGFARNINTHAVIPVDIIQLIDAYFPHSLAWDQSKHGDNVHFPASNIAVYQFSSAICMSNFGIASSKCMQQIRMGNQIASFWISGVYRIYCQSIGEYEV